jgi:L-malate glycosyltransferase
LRAETSAKSCMRIAISAPIQIDRLASWLPQYDERELPVGFGGSPSTTVALGLLARGHELVIVTLDPTIDAPVELRGERVEVRVAPSRTHGRARDYFRLEREYVRDAILDAANRIDVVSAHWAYEFALGALQARVPTAVHLQDWAPALVRYAPEGARAHFAVRALMSLDVVRRSRHLSAPSPYIAYRARRWARRPVAVIPNPISEDGFLETPRRRASGRCSIVAINQGFSPFKNVGALLEAFPEIRSAMPHAQLRLIGRGMEIGGPAWKWADARGLAAGVEFAGFLVGHGQVRAALDASDLLVHPSLQEAFSMVVADAMARSVPVVAGQASGGVPWVLDEGRSGVLVDVRSPAAIASGVIRLLRDDDDWERLASAALESARRRFSATTVVEQYENLLADVAARPRG